MTPRNWDMPNSDAVMAIKNSYDFVKFKQWGYSW